MALNTTATNKAELKEFHDMLVAIRDNVAALKKADRTLEENRGPMGMGPM